MLILKELIQTFGKFAPDIRLERRVSCHRGQIPACLSIVQKKIKNGHSKQLI
jgi:hypothetical protein